MENREILIANTKTQKRSKITTDATTLAELKSALDAAGVDYSGMTFTEGISKTQLLDDATQLPQNVMYKGQATNNLVILLTNTKKNIASGAEDRKTAYQLIKDNDLQAEVISKYGHNFTQVPTADLWKVINENTDFEVKDEEIEEIEGEDYDDEDSEETSSLGSTVADAVIAFVNSLYTSGVLTDEEVNNIASSIAAPVATNNLGKVQLKSFKTESISTTDGLINGDDIDNMVSEIVR